MRRRTKTGSKRVCIVDGWRAARKDEGGEGRKGVVGQTEGGQEGSEW